MHCTNIQIYSPSGYGTQKRHILDAELSQVEWKQLLCLVRQHDVGPTSKTVINIEWDYNYHQPWSDNEWLVDEMLAMLDKDITMQ